nr:MAG TPA: hypothetical protein [Inoviridae sp.]
MPGSSGERSSLWESQAYDLQGGGFNLLKAPHCWEYAVLVELGSC